MDNNKLVLIDQNGEKQEYDIVAIFSNEKDKFVAFTDNKKDLMVLKYSKSTEKENLEPVSEEDKNFVENYLKRYVFSEE